SYDPQKEELTLIARSCIPEGHGVVYDGKKHKVKSFENPDKEFTVFYGTDMGCAKYRKLDENRTLLKQVIIFDGAGWTQNKLFQKLAAYDRAKRFRTELVKHLKAPN